MKKRLILLICTCALLCALTSCGKEKTSDSVPPEDTAPPKNEVIVPEPSAPAPAPETSEPPVQSEEPSIPTAGWSGMLTAYEEILREWYDSYEDPERFRYEDGPNFALYDVDCDGVEELIARDTVGEVAGQWLKIYGYDDGKREAYIELEEFPNLYYYDNGIIEAGLSHNQGVAGDKLWPYTLYQYNASTGLYEKIAMVDGWDKSLTEAFAGKRSLMQSIRTGTGLCTMSSPKRAVTRQPTAR